MVGKLTPRCTSLQVEGNGSLKTNIESATGEVGKANEPAERIDNSLEVGKNDTEQGKVESATATTIDKTQKQPDSVYTEKSVDVRNIIEGNDLPEAKTESAVGNARKNNQSVRTDNSLEVGKDATLHKQAENSIATPVHGSRTQEQPDDVYPEKPAEGQNIVEGNNPQEAKAESTTTPAGKPNDSVRRTDNLLEVGKDFRMPEGVENSTANPMATDNTQEQPDSFFPEERVDVQNLKDRVRANILTRVRTRTPNEYREIRLQLSPEHLGKVIIKVSQHNNAVSAQIQANTLAAKEIIESELSQLRNELTDQDINIEELNVSVGSETSDFQQHSNRSSISTTRYNHNNRNSAQEEEPTPDNSSEESFYEPYTVNLIA